MRRDAWVEEIISENLSLSSPYQIRLIQGSHIVISQKLYDCHKALYYAKRRSKDRFCNSLFRKIYPHWYNRSGYTGDPQKVEITDVEIDYLLTVTNSHFKKAVDAS